MRAEQVLFAWPIGSRHGWGIRGLGMALNWPGIAVSALPELDAELPPDDPRQALLAERIQQSRMVQEKIIATAGAIVQFEAPVFTPLGNDLTAAPIAGGRYIRGKPHIACAVFEDVANVSRNIHRLNEYDAVVVASRWNQEVLADFGVDAKLCHEGIDPVIFNPSVRKPRNDGRFRVFSGGKAEYRKGQDIVIEAFKIFAEKHDDALLAAAWGSPWNMSAADFEGKWEYGAPPGTHIGMPNYHAWVERAGIKPHQFELVPQMPNWQMAEVYGGCDVAIFPNRCEGGTNFVAMECMACAVRTIANEDYGQGDLPEEFTFSGDTEEINDWLSYIYERRRDRPRLLFLDPYWSWERHCREIAEIAANV